MHVKYIHELCIIILIFQSYLHHIRVISLFYNDFGKISQFSYFSGINLALAENPIFYILMYQGSKRRPNDLKIYGDHFLEETKHGEKGWEKVEARRPKGGAPRGPCTRPRGPTSFGPRGPVCDDPSSRSFLVT